MRQFYEVTQAIKDALIGDDNVNTVTLGDAAEIDLAKQNIYPLAHIIPGGVSLNGSTLTMSFDIVFMDVVSDSITDLRDVNDTLHGQNDLQDVWNTQLQVANRLVSRMQRGDLFSDLVQTTDGSLEPFKDEYENLLAGWVLSVDVLTPNNDMCITVNSTDLDATAYFLEVETQGGTISASVKQEYSDFVLREKAAGRYTKIKRLYPYLGGVIDSARINAITLTQATNNNLVDADADSLIGLQGDGSTKYLTDDLAATIWASDDDWQIYWYSLIAETADRHVFGATSGGNDRVSLRRRNVTTGNNYIYGNNNANVVTIGGSFASNQSVFGGRFSNTDLTIYEDSNTVTNVTADIYAFPVTYPIGILARNGASPQFSDEKVGGVMMAEGMTKADMVAFDTSYKTFLTNIGAI